MQWDSSRTDCQLFFLQLKLKSPQYRHCCYGIRNIRIVGLFYDPTSYLLHNANRLYSGFSVFLSHIPDA